MTVEEDKEAPNDWDLPNKRQRSVLPEEKNKSFRVGIQNTLLRKEAVNDWRK